MTTFKMSIPTSISTKRRWKRWPDRRPTAVRVLGIDCGTERTGWGVIESDGRRHAVLAHGVILLSPKEALCDRLAAVGAALRLLLPQHAPEAAAVEEVF